MIIIASQFSRAELHPLNIWILVESVCALFVRTPTFCSFHNYLVVAAV